MVNNEDIINQNFNLIDQAIGDHADRLEALAKEIRYLAAIAVIAFALSVCCVLAIVIS